MIEGLHKKYGLFTAVALVVGIVIGSGVFFKAQTILQVTGGDLVTGIIAWIIGGLVVLSCILAFAILATKYEKQSGMVDYAEAAVGPRYGYFVGWFTATIYMPTITSVLAWLSARYTLVFITSTFPNFPMTIPASEGGCVNGPETMALAMVYMCGAYALNALSPILAGKFQVATTIIKMIPLLLMAVVGILLGLVSKDGLLIQNMMAEPAAEASANGSPLFAAVVATSFAYEGWIIATSINAELKDAKRNLPIALVAGGIIIVAVYIAYYVGVAGGATIDELIAYGATVAFTNVFGETVGAILNIFIAVSCLGTLNGLMLGCTRGLYALAVRGEGPKPETFSKVDPSTNMANNSAIVALILCAFWFFFFYGSNLAPAKWFGPFGFDSSELPIVTLYAMYVPVFIGFMKKATEMPAVKRYVIPGLGAIGSSFMVFAAVCAHGYQPYIKAAANGEFACPVIFYLIVFAVVMVIGMRFAKPKKVDK